MSEPRAAGPDQEQRAATGDALWVITSFFNPAGYRRRRENYRRFRQRLAAALVTVELPFDGRFELSAGDADVLVQIHGGDVMWQNERLLNLALRSVPAGVDKIAWVDCDVLFARDDWVAQARRALDVHLFDERCDLPHDAASGDLRPDPHGTVPSIVDKIVAEGIAAADLLVSAARPAAQSVETGSPGRAAATCWTCTASAMGASWEMAIAPSCAPRSGRSSSARARSG